MGSISKILFIIVPILIACTFIFTIMMILSPKFRGKLMARQIKATKYMLDESKDSLEAIGKTAGNIGINIKKDILDENKDNLKNIARDEADIVKDSIKIKARAIKEGLTKENIFWKYCGEPIDEDSIYCKICGKKQ